MSALTYEVKDPQSPVAVWLRTTFPEFKDVQAAFRVAAGPQRILLPATVAPGTQGAAIDWRLRMLVDRAVSIDLPVTGLRSRRAPCMRAGMELLVELGGGTGRRNQMAGAAMQPSRFADRPDDWWARVCYALALLVELYRATSVDNSRLMQLTPSSRAADLLALANDAEVADLTAMRDLARERLLLGYALMDYSDRFALHTVAIYAARFGYLSSWPITELGERMSGHPVDLAHLRKEFAHVLRAYLAP